MGFREAVEYVADWLGRNVDEIYHPRLEIFLNQMDEAIRQSRELSMYASPLPVPMPRGH